MPFHAPLKIGQIGLGQITVVHRDGYRSYGLPVVAGTDISETVRDQFAREMPGARVHPTLDELLADPEVDVLDVAAPHHATIRRPLLEKVFAAGKPVLLQKPFAHTYADALAYTEWAEAAGAPLMINQNSLFCGGVLDTAARITGTQFSPLVWGSVRHVSYHDPKNHPWFGKGPRWWMTDMAVHELAILHHFFGPPDSVYAVMGRDPQETGVEGDGYVHAIFRYPNGASIVMNESGAYLGPDTKNFMFEFHGNSGTVSLYPGKHAIWSPRDGESFEEAAIIRWFPEGFGLAMAHFQWALQNKRTPWAAAADNLFVLAVVEAAYRSSREGRSVPVAEIMGDRWIPDYGPGFLRGPADWIPPEPVSAPQLVNNYAWATYVPEKKTN
jgi:predicted dehydrogenase